MTEELLAEISVLKEKLAKAEKERDAAIEDLEFIRACYHCNHYWKYRNDCSLLEVCNWEWRGIQDDK